MNNDKIREPNVENPTTINSSAWLQGGCYYFWSWPFSKGTKLHLAVACQVVTTHAAAEDKAVIEAKEEMQVNDL
jgi:hypothetical protein